MTARDDVYEFARWVIQHCMFEGRDLDSFDCELKAIELGLLIETKQDPDFREHWSPVQRPKTYVFSDQLSEPTSVPWLEPPIAVKGIKP